MQSVYPTVNTEINNEYHRRDDVMYLCQQVADLTIRVNNLENANHLKDNKLERIECDNERLKVELKRQQRCNRNLKQQLDDGTNKFYIKSGEITPDSCSKEQAEFDNNQKILSDVNDEIQKKLLDKNTTTYNLCIKFLRMKNARDIFRQKFNRLSQEHLQIMSEMMHKLDEAREELNVIVSDKFRGLPPNKAQFLQVVQRNSRLVYENAALKLDIHRLTQDLEKLKSQTQTSNLININTRSIDKLSTCHQKQLRAQSTPTRQDEDNLKIVPNVREIIQRIECKSCSDKNSKASCSESLKIQANTTQSAPGIIEIAKFQPDRFSDSSTEYENSG